MKSRTDEAWDRLAGAALRARTTFRLILAKSIRAKAGHDVRVVLAEILKLAAERSEDLTTALKNPNSRRRVQ